MPSRAGMYAEWLPAATVARVFFGSVAGRRRVCGAGSRAEKEVATMPSPFSKAGASGGSAGVFGETQAPRGPAASRVPVEPQECVWPPTPWTPVALTDTVESARHGDVQLRSGDREETDAGDRVPADGLRPHGRQVRALREALRPGEGRRAGRAAHARGGGRPARAAGGDGAGDGAVPARGGGDRQGDRLALHRI